MCMQRLLCWFRTVTPVVQLNVQHVYLVETVIKYKVWSVGSRLALSLRSSNEHNTVIGCAVMTLAVVLLLLLSSSPSSNSKNQKPNEKKNPFVFCHMLPIVNQCVHAINRISQEHVYLDVVFVQFFLWMHVGCALQCNVYAPGCWMQLTTESICSMNMH